MRHFPLRSTRSELFFPFFYIWTITFSFWGKFSGQVVSRSGNHGRPLVVLFVIYTQSLYYLFDITVHLSSVPFKTALCLMLGLTGLATSVENHFTGYRFRKMPTTLKITGESSYVATNVLGNALWPINSVWVNHVKHGSYKRLWYTHTFTHGDTNTIYCQGPGSRRVSKLCSYRHE